MTLSPTAAWSAEFEKATPDIVYYITITRGVNSWSAVSKSMDATSDLAGTDVGVLKVSPVSAELDPLTRAVQVGEVYVDVLDAWIRPIAVNYHLEKSKISIKIGASNLNAADFLGLISGVIEEYVPVNGEYVTLNVMDCFVLTDSMMTMGTWIGKHPLEVLYKGDGSGILERAGVQDFDTTSFDPSDAAYADISHLVISLGMAGSEFGGDVSDETAISTGGFLSGPIVGLESPTKAVDLANSVCRLLNGHLNVDEDGKIKFVRFKSSLGSSVTWGDDEIIPGSIKQSPVGTNIANKIQASFERDPYNSANYLLTIQLGDATSQAALAYPGASARVCVMEFATDWLDSICMMSGYFDGKTKLAIADTNFMIGGQTYGISGYRTEAWAQVSATRPLYLHIAGHTMSGVDVGEIIKVEKVYKNGPATGPDGDAALNQVLYYKDLSTYTYDTPYTISCPYILSCTNITRQVWGSNPLGDDINLSPPNNTVIDITSIVILAEELLKRFSYGASIIDLKTKPSEYKYQVGDFVAINAPYLLSYGADGYDSGDKFEIVGKEIDFDSSTPGIKWKLAYAGENAISTSVQVRPKTPVWGIERDNLLNSNITQTYVVSGGAVTSVAGLEIGIAAGLASNGKSSFRMLKDTTHTVEDNKDTYVIADTRFNSLMFISVATGAATPTLSGNQCFLAKVAAAAGAVTITTAVKETLPIVGSKLKAGSGPLTYLNQSTGYLDSLAHVTTATLNQVADDPAGTWRKVKSINANNEIVEASIAATAVTATKVADSAIGLVHVDAGEERGFCLNINAAMSMYTRG